MYGKALPSTPTPLSHHQRKLQNTSMHSKTYLRFATIIIHVSNNQYFDDKLHIQLLDNVDYLHVKCKIRKEESGNEF